MCTLLWYVIDNHLGLVVCLHWSVSIASHYEIPRVSNQSCAVYFHRQLDVMMRYVVCNVFADIFTISVRYIMLMSMLFDFVFCCSFVFVVVFSFATTIICANWRSYAKFLDSSFEIPEIDILMFI